MSKELEFSTVYYRNFLVSKSSSVLLGNVCAWPCARFLTCSFLKGKKSLIDGILAKDWLPESGGISTLMLIFYNTNETTFSVDKITAYVSDKFYIYVFIVHVYTKLSAKT